MLQTQKIGIIGSEGYVGKVMINFFKDHYEVIGRDPSLRTKSATQEEINKCDLAVICVPTEMKEDGNCNVSIVEECVNWIKTPVIWIRSTVCPGTTNRLIKKYDKRIVFSPEYAGEGKYWMPWKFHTDEKEVPFFILGGNPVDTQYILDLIVPIAGPTKHYRQMGALEAEVAKYMENIYFAMKVTFANEMRKACDALGANYWIARDGWALDPRVDKMHTAVFPNKVGFSGRCLPKDLMGFIKACEKHHYNPLFLKEIWNSNERFQKNRNN